jgi:hypothetical protein
LLRKSVTVRIVWEQGIFQQSVPNVQEYCEVKDLMASFSALSNEFSKNPDKELFSFITHPEAFRISLRAWLRGFLSVLQIDMHFPHWQDTRYIPMNVRYGLWLS